MLFTPMLHEVAAGELEMSDIVSPIRKMLRRAVFLKLKCIPSICPTAGSPSGMGYLPTAMNWLLTTRPGIGFGNQFL